MEKLFYVVKEQRSRESEPSTFPKKEDGYYFFKRCNPSGRRENTLTCYDSEGKTFLINGLLNTTHYFDKQIAGYQGISDRQQSSIGIKYPKKSKKVRSLYRRKKNKVTDFIHKTTRYVAEYCLAEHITTILNYYLHRILH